MVQTIWPQDAQYPVSNAKIGRGDVFRPSAVDQVNGFADGAIRMRLKRPCILTCHSGAISRTVAKSDRKFGASVARQTAGGAHLFQQRLAGPGWTSIVLVVPTTSRRQLNAKKG